MKAPQSLAVVILAVAALLAGGWALWPRTGSSRNSPGASPHVLVSGLVLPSFRRDKRRLSAIEDELKQLPALRDIPFGYRYGFRSGTILTEDEPHWVQIDLKHKRPIDCLVVVPAHVPGSELRGYGFPRRFTIQVGNLPDMADAVTVVDESQTDVPNPGSYPLICPIQPTTGQYVRFTSTRHFSSEEGFIWALEELFVLSGNISTATGMETSGTSSLELYPNWSRQRLNDGQSTLGIPTTTEPSPTIGYACERTTDPYARKEVVIDLGSVHPIDEIRWLPVEPMNFQALGWHSFPRAWIAQMARQEDFSDAEDFAPPFQTNQPGYPGFCAVITQGNGREARYVRLQTQSMWGAENSCGFALSEVQIYSNGKNIALGKPVRVTDTWKDGDPTKWAPSHLVDGFSSRHRLIEMPDYLKLISRRKRLEEEHATIGLRLDATIRMASLVLVYGGCGVGGAGLLGWWWLLARSRTMREQAVTRLREQIARDLHDDIGSNLGGIVLLSDMGSRNSADAQARDDFQSIKEAAEETSHSMQDIVWLIERGEMSLAALVTRMRRSAATLLGEEVATVSVAPPEFRDRKLTLFFVRHFFLAFKETLNNVRRHARANKVNIRISIGVGDLSFEVVDNGTGFDLAQNDGSGHGLANLQRRAQRLDGSCRIESGPGRGTKVSFEAPLKTENR